MTTTTPLRAVLAAALTLLLVSTNLATAAPPQKPGPITTPDPGNNKPAPDFDPDIWVKLAAQDPYADISCYMDGLEDKVGVGITMKNNTGKTILAGSIIVWTLPNGKKITMTVPQDIPPGGWMGTDAPKWMKNMVGFWCTVKVTWAPARQL
jgi:hypothetical protein